MNSQSPGQTRYQAALAQESGIRVGASPIYPYENINTSDLMSISAAENINS